VITLYRAYSADDELLYIGISANVTKREKAHRYSSEWCTTDVRFVPGETFVERKDARAAEKAAIRAELPSCNIDGVDHMNTPEHLAYIKAVVDAAPPLSDAQRTKLAALLRPGAEAAFPRSAADAATDGAVA